MQSRNREKFPCQEKEISRPTIHVQLVTWSTTTLVRTTSTYFSEFFQLPAAFLKIFPFKDSHIFEPFLRFLRCIFTKNSIHNLNVELNCIRSRASVVLQTLVEHTSLLATFAVSGCQCTSRLSLVLARFVYLESARRRLYHGISTFSCDCNLYRYLNVLCSSKLHKQWSEGWKDLQAIRGC